MKKSILINRLVLSSAVYLFLSGGKLYADSALWDLDPISGIWTTPTNWTPDLVPNGPGDIATFGVSNVTDVLIPAGPLGVEVDSIVFNSGASAYTITALAGGISAQLTISGAGIINNSGITQNFVTLAAQPGSRISFTNSATAGTLTVFTNDRTGSISFGDSSSAGSATFFNAAATNPLDGPARINFFGNSTAGNAVITNFGGASPGTGGGQTGFSGNSTAANATLIANSSSTPSAGGGIVFFEGDSTGGTARVALFGNGLLDIGAHNSGITIGSLEGNGIASLGANNLAVGTNHRSTIFSGTIQDGGTSGGTGASFTKVGLGNLTLSGSNTYTGPTTVNAGKLFVDGSITSAVTVNGGTLGGSGNTGNVNVNSGGTLAPGQSAAILDVPVNGLSGGAGILHVAGNVVLTLGATYLVDLNGTAVGTSYDQVAVMGGVNLGGALLSLSLGFAPSIGDVFTIVDNDASDAIGGTFDGLAEGGQITAGGETFAISYQGGDGNDVTLTSAAHEPGFSGPIPEPTTWALLLTGAVFAGYSMRRLRHS